jgi:pimeloyl-ACP methyl ester carboxylesterase
MAEAGRGLENARARPGLSLLATEDPYIGSDEIRRRAAERSGAHTEVLNGLGHWWMVQDPARGAEALTEFWATIE